jgi:glycosyltransferase involved in cell wall biosynthesis
LQVASTNSGHRCDSRPRDSEERKSIDILVQSVPPVHDAIGEYTAYFAQHLRDFFDVCLYTSRGFIPQLIDGVTIDQSFDLSAKHRFATVFDRLLRSDAEALLLQYNPFAWGKRGWARDLPKLLRDLKRKKPDLLVTIMFHETFMIYPGLRYRVMRFYQERQFRKLLAVADLAFYSSSKWAEQHQANGGDCVALTLPVGSNLPLSGLDQVAAKRRLGFDDSDFVCSVFGGSHVSRMFERIDVAVGAIAESLAGQSRTRLIYIGDSDRAWKVGDAMVHCLGRLSAQSAADAIAASDLMINPFLDGISTRRGSAMAALQHGVPVLTTKGHNTEEVWTQEAVRSVCMVDVAEMDRLWADTAVRFAHQVNDSQEGMRTSIRSFYRRNFDWPVTTKYFAEKVIERLSIRKNE